MNCDVVPEPAVGEGEGRESDETRRCSGGRAHGLRHIFSLAARPGRQVKPPFLPNLSALILQALGAVGLAGASFLSLFFNSTWDGARPLSLFQEYIYLYW